MKIIASAVGRAVSLKGVV